MKSKKYIFNMFLAGTLAAGMASCDDFLDKEPMSNISPENYYSTASQLEAVLLDNYPNVLPYHSNWSYGLFGEDSNR